MIIADNGSNWFISGVPDERWNNAVLAELKQVHGSGFGAVDISSLMISSDSGQARSATGGTVSGRLTTSFAGHKSLSVGNAVISLKGVKDYSPTTYSSDGSFIFQDLEPGNYTLTVTASNLFVLDRQITLAASENKSLDIPPMTIINDINGDGKEGLQEAIHALQVSAGLRP
jgi:hypothetical protein